MNKIIVNTYPTSVVKNEIFTQAAKYFIVGGFCTIVDFVILFIFTHFLKLNYLTSSIISFTSGTVINYYLCTIYIFKIRVIEKRHQEFIYYIIISGIGLGINTLIIWSITEFFGLYYMLSKLIAVFVTYFWNFGARKYFLHTFK